MIRPLLIILALSLLAATAAAQTPAKPNDALSAAVADEEIGVSSEYRGARVTVFGAAPGLLKEGVQDGDVVVVLRGPGLPVRVSRKRRLAGFWLDADAVEFTGAPSFFAAASARPLPQIADGRSTYELGLDPAALARKTGEQGQTDLADFRRALRTLKEESGLWQQVPLRVENGLFVAHIRLPGSAPPGDYFAEVYLFREGRLVASESRSIEIRRTGIERDVHDFAMRQEFLHGVAVVAMAVFAGWAAAAIFRRT